MAKLTGAFRDSQLNLKSIFK